LDSTGAVSRARIQRRTLTPPEARLWRCVQRRQLAGLKFRRQHPIGAYVLDFYCPEARLAVEVDGQTHDHPDQQRRDERRTRGLVQQGIAVLRIAAEDVRINLDGVLVAIRDAAESRLKNPSTASRSPSPSQGDGEET
jgi:very-short-patch-repair endonuclease